MVKLSLPALLLGLASTVFAAAMPRDLLPNQVDIISARDVFEDAAGKVDLAARTNDVAEQVNNAIGKCSSGMQPHVQKIKDGCSSGTACPLLGIELLVEFKAIIALAIELVADIKLVASQNPSIKVPAQGCYDALKLFIGLLLEAILAVKLSVCLSLFLPILGQFCLAIVQVFLALDIVLDGCVSVLGLIAADLQLTVEILLAVNLGCLQTWFGF